MSAATGSFSRLRKARPGPTATSISAGDLVHIPPDVYHETINTGWEPLRILAVYAPPGPEAFLRGLPECKVVPAGEIPKRA